MLDIKTSSRAQKALMMYFQRYKNTSMLRKLGKIIVYHFVTNK